MGALLGRDPTVVVDAEAVSVERRFALQKVGEGKHRHTQGCGQVGRRLCNRFSVGSRCRVQAAAALAGGVRAGCRIRDLANLEPVERAGPLELLDDAGQVLTAGHGVPL
jgi:hypothetical protein